ncbi:UDP-galactose transporter [Sparassis crispa]|uniref:UDP-galactose transporter n=1 Tax=Sparassis crispa TaxID=139825 RepID=A0A401GIC1_9APHY|nr:UDP-galactose transporter [Sparassis crispa]GBE81861.1 UDP-galactose transporter [Sparassis crispa]
MDRPVPRRASAFTASKATPAALDMYHRPYPTSRTGTPSPLLEEPSHHLLLPRSSPRLTPTLPLSLQHTPQSFASKDVAPSSVATDNGPTVCGMPLKYVSLITLAVQNAALSIVMHYSRVSTPASQAYSPATAVLLNELLKGAISFVVAFFRVASAADPSGMRLTGCWLAFRKVCRDIFSPDCWKLSIPAILYVVQNSLQFVAISNLPVATFQVTYQMKILTTAAFSVALLRKKISSTKWLSLFFLAIGVGIVQIQSGSGHIPQRQNVVVGSAHESAPLHIHIMSPLKGFGAVTAACFTSGLAGVYFEMVLKNSKADLWVRNVQLSLFSLVPAVLPIIFETPAPHSRVGGSIMSILLRNFGGWAWATVIIQVLGGLITAVVIKYSDNILKGFATSLSIVLSFLASVALFGFRITPSFLIGSSTVLIATFMYNQPPGKELVTISGVMPARCPTPTFPNVSPDAPIIGQFPPQKKSSPFSSPRILANALGLANEKSEMDAAFGETLDTPRYLSAPYGSPYPSRTPSPNPTPPCPPPNSAHGFDAHGRWQSQ